MEGTPFIAENNSDREKERRRKEGAENERESRVKKPEIFGMIAVEPSPEKAIAATRPPDPEALEKKPDAEEEPVVLAETEPPSDRVPEEDARRIVHEMVRARQEADAEEATAEPEPAEVPGAEVAEAAEPIAKPEAEPVVTVEAAETEPAADEVTAEPEPAEHVEALEPAPESELEPPAEPKPELRPEAEEPEAPADDKKKPGFISSLFRRRERDKDEEEPAPEADKAEEEIPEPPEEAPEPPKTKGPEFRFNEHTEDAEETDEAEETPEAPEEEAKPAHKTGPEHIGQMLFNTGAAPAEQQAATG